jgi:multidrug efflux pump subunit AcrB
MWVAHLALRRPYTFVMVAIMTLLATPLAIIKTSIDGLLSIQIPVFSVIWNCAGMPAKDMSERFTSSSGRLWLCSED